MSQSERVTGVLQFVASDRRGYHNHKQCEKCYNQRKGSWSVTIKESGRMENHNQNQCPMVSQSKGGGGGG